MKKGNRYNNWNNISKDISPDEVRNKLLKIINVIFEKRKLLSDFKKTLNIPLYQKGDRSECDNYRGINLVSISCKFFVG